MSCFVFLMCYFVHSTCLTLHVFTFNSIVSMGQMADGPQLERAFAGATVHDLFNILTTAILFPLEVITGYLYHLTKAMLPESVSDGDDWE